MTMIVAHPDDELIFGWKHLTTSSVFSDHHRVGTVWCVTAPNFKRLFIFRLGGLLLRYKTRCLYLEDSSTGMKLEAEVALRSLLIAPSVSNFIVVTQNPTGEYGHPQHREISQVASVCVPLDNLRFFDRPNSNMSPDCSWRYRFLKNLYLKTVKKKWRHQLVAHFDNNFGTSSPAVTWLDAHDRALTVVGHDI